MLNRSISMGGIGIKIKSRQRPDSDAPAVPAANLPQKVVDEIISTLGVTRVDEVRQALTTGKLDIPDDVEIEIQRLSTGTSLTITPVQGGQEFTLNHQGQRRSLKR
jgi:hypothetical protein